MRARMFRIPAHLALLAVLAHVVVGALGGKVCIRMAPFPPSDGCTSDCCEHGRIHAQASVAPDQTGLPVDSDCCIEFGDSDLFVSAAVHSSLHGAPGLPFPMPGVERKALDRRRAPILAVGVAVHPPPGLVVIRTTVLLI